MRAAAPIPIRSGPPTWRYWPGADGITAHLREDRRHIRDLDMERLKRQLFVPLNFEMAATPEMIGLAVAPAAACVPASSPRSARSAPPRAGSTSSAGACSPASRHQGTGDAGIRVSLFVEPEVEIMEAARDLGAPVVELHTGT